MQKIALITGVSGQDGSYLAEQLLQSGYRVAAYLRPGSSGLGCSSHLIGKIATRSFPMDAQERWNEWVGEVCPDTIFHLGASTFIPDSWRDPLACHDSNVRWSIRILDAIRDASPKTRLVIASSSEIFGRPVCAPQNEATPTCPVTPYGVTKASTFWMAHSYRQRYGLFVANAILYNHESPRRPIQFVTRKISRGAAAIALGQQSKLVLGNLDIQRDWGFAGDYVQAMQRMVELDHAEDFVIGSGRLATLESVVKMAFDAVQLDYRKFVEIDSSFVRPLEPTALVADPSKAKEKLKWEATTSLPELIRSMVAHDVQELSRQRVAA